MAEKLRFLGTLGASLVLASACSADIKPTHTPEPVPQSEPSQNPELIPSNYVMRLAIKSPATGKILVCFFNSYRMDLSQTVKEVNSIGTTLCPNTAANKEMLKHGGALDDSTSFIIAGGVSWELMNQRESYISKGLPVPPPFEANP